MTTPAPALFVDRDGEVWRSGGRTADGDELMACDHPQDPEEVGGPGPTDFPWTRQTVETWLGPLMPIGVAS